MTNPDPERLLMLAEAIRELDSHRDLFTDNQWERFNGVHYDGRPASGFGVSASCVHQATNDVRHKCRHHGLRAR